MLHRQLPLFILLFFLPFTSYSHSVDTDTSSVEWIKAYFNMPPDYSVALPGNKSNSNADLIGSLETLINNAKHSVDLAIYDLEHPRIARALVEAKQRGVQLRVVTDNYNRTDAGKIDSLIWAKLRTAGIASIDDDGDIYNPDGSRANHSLVNSGADMHHKFAVIDAKSPSPEDDYVWTGSTNLTYTGAYNTNNTIVIKDNGIARAYQNEFEQMWGSNGPVPKAANARFHKDKRDIDKHTYFIDKTRVELYFAPVNRIDTKPSIMQRLVEVIREQAQHDIAFQAFAITPSIPLSRTIWEMSATGEVALQGIIDPMFYYRYKKQGAIWASREAKVTNRMILPANEMRKLHHKVMLLDANHPDASDKGVTIAGSYNFSKNAEKNNDENLLVIYSDSITNQYYQDFKGVERRAVGEMRVPAPPINSDKWYVVKQVSDGSRFAIEVLPGFEYDVRFLGVDMPRIYAGNDSSEYYSAEAAEYLRHLLDGARVKVEGADGAAPQARYGAYQAYVTMKKEGKTVALNKRLLQRGFGKYDKYYSQNPDSIKAFKRYVANAKDRRTGIWKDPRKIGQKMPRADILKNDTEPAEVFPININTADEALLDLLPGIGPAYAKRIVSYRKQYGAFTEVGQLRNIKGIGPKTMQKLRPNVVIEGE